MIDWTPGPIVLQLGPIPLYWYGVAYAVGLLGVYVVATRMAVRYGQNPDYVGNGMILIGVAALIGGRLYHVIDQFQLYRDDLLKIVLPPYTGLGVYGGMITGLIAFFYLSRRWHLDLWTWADVAAPAIFVMQGFGRWGNFFNQELYGPPTSLPWGIAIDCAHRVAAYPCAAFPLATTHFAPLFLYESVSGFVGAAVLMWLASKPRPRLRRGDLLPIMFIWYAIVRFLLENLRTGNWKLEGIATAQIFSIGFIVAAMGLLAYRHRTAPPSDMVGVPPEGRNAADASAAPPTAPNAGSAGTTPPAPDPEPLT
ncbi:MAG TPA: prolipoprotein diacylglyceryl transferase [Candidatus Limnocylindrales bacterium]